MRPIETYIYLPAGILIAFILLSVALDDTVLS